MGTADREYARERRGGTGFLTNLTPVIKWLMIVNAAVFLADVFLHKRLSMFGAFSIRSAIFEGRVWEFFTFQFLHAHLAHVLMNMMGLFFFGPWMERWWGSQRFLVFYLLAGAGGAAFFTLLAFLNVLPNGFDSGLVGASAGLYGILAGVAVIAPNARVALLFPPIEMSMRTLAIALLAIAAGSILFKIGGNEGGEAGHLGGALVGFLLVRYPQFLSWAIRRQRDVEVIRPRVFSPKSDAKLRPRSKVDLRASSEVDLILDKISRNGFQSLTDAERETLQRAANPDPANPPNR